MTTILKRKRQAYESLLKITEEMEHAVLNGDYEAIAEMTVSRDSVIKKITSIDEDMKIPPYPPFSKGDSSASPPLEKGGEGEFEVEASEIMALIQMVAEINQRLIVMVGERLHRIEDEMVEMRKKAGAIAEYGKISAL